MGDGEAFARLSRRAQEAMRELADVRERTLDLSRPWAALEWTRPGVDQEAWAVCGGTPGIFFRSILVRMGSYRDSPFSPGDVKITGRWPNALGKKVPVIIGLQPNPATCYLPHFVDRFVVS